MACGSERLAIYGLELLLIAFGILMTIGFLLTYVIAVSMGHVEAYLPYISDTGTQIPESCVFTLVCCLGSILLLIVMSLKYKHLHHYYHHTLREMHCLNVLSLCVGVLSVLGLIVVGSFQAGKVSVVHFLGAFTVFGFGVLYCWLQTFITFRLYRAKACPYVSCPLLFFRILFTLLSTGTLITALLFGIIGGHSKDNFTLHLVSSVSEWALAFNFMLYFLTFHPDFTRISLDYKVSLKTHHHTDIIHRHSIISTDDENSPLTI